MPKKPVGILKRNAYTSKSADKPKKRKKGPINSSAPASAHVNLGVSNDLPLSSRKMQPQQLQQQQEQQQQKFWACQSEVDRQAAACISKLLAADSSKRNGKTIKSLTLAPHIKAKKAVYAITCQTLQRTQRTACKHLSCWEPMQLMIAFTRCRSTNYPATFRQDVLIRHTAASPYCSICSSIRASVWAGIVRYMLVSDITGPTECLSNICALVAGL